MKYNPILHNNDNKIPSILCLDRAGMPTNIEVCIYEGLKSARRRYRAEHIQVNRLAKGIK